MWQIWYMDAMSWRKHRQFSIETNICLLQLILKAQADILYTKRGSDDQFLSLLFFKLLQLGFRILKYLQLGMKLTTLVGSLTLFYLDATSCVVQEHERKKLAKY